jgi:hypothetical protein
MKGREFISMLGGALSAFIVQAHRRKKDITGQATTTGIKASTRRSKEMTAKVRAAT